MNSIINFIDGRKTYIGIVCLFLSGAISTWFTATGWTQIDIVKGIQALFDYIGYSFAGVGVADKFRKGQIVIPTETPKDTTK